MSDTPENTPAQIETSPAPTPSPNSETPPSQPSGTPEWVQPRINQLTKERYEEQRAKELAEARAKAAEAALEQLRGGNQQTSENLPNPNVDKKTFTLDEVEKMVSERSRLQATQERLSSIYSDGKGKFKDEFDQSLRNLNNVGWGSNAQSINLADAASETGKAAEVLHYLGSDLAKAQQIINLPPARMGVELAKIAAKLENEEGGENNVSKAPNPIKPQVRGTGTVGKPTLYEADKMSTKEWIQERNRQLRERRKNEGR